VKVALGGLAVVAAACVASDGASMVGESLQDAGAVIADAGEWLADAAGDGAAAQDSTAECRLSHAQRIDWHSLERPPGSYDETQHFVATVDATAGAIAKALVCDQENDIPVTDACGVAKDRTCSTKGTPPRVDCQEVPVSYGNGKAWVSCGYRIVNHTVREGAAALHTEVGYLSKRVVFKR
jgi:hypothetical protein